MGGHATITVVGSKPGMLDSASAELDRLEKLWSRFLPDSDISRMNSAEGAPTRVDPLTVGLLEAMSVASAETDGDYDPSLLPALVEAGYRVSLVHHDRSTLLPSSARAGGQLSTIRTAGNLVTVPLGLTIDAGGIAKGHAAGLICARLRDAGAEGAMVEIAGDIVVFGRAPDEVAWRLGVEDPFDTAKHLDVIRLSDGAVATSSRLKRRWTVDGARHHHLIDPRTGQSSVSTTVAATIIANSGARAETLAKVAFMRDVRDTLEWLPSRGAAGLIVTEDGVVHVSSNWENYR